MIHVERDPEPNISIYTEKKYISPEDGTTMITKVQEETERAIIFFANPAHFKEDKKITKKKFSPDFKVYSNKELRAALEACFYSKCAYCETKMAAVTPFDVEHFRPKKEIHTGKKEIAPGYYWLSAAWDNLLASCPFCNRLNELEIAKKEKKETQGKHTKFPLSDQNEEKRVRRHNQQISKEEPVRLLLNPCVEDPEMYLTYDEEGLIHVREGVAGHASKMALTSRRDYALQRKDLVEARLGVLNGFKFQVEQLIHYADEQGRLSVVHEALKAAGLTDAQNANEASINANKEQVKKVVKQLKLMTSAKEPYLGMLRDYIRKGKAANEFNELSHIKVDLEDLIK